MFELKIKTENSAFEGNELHPELLRILSEVRVRVYNDLGTGCYQTIVDRNGNACGHWRLRPDT